MKTDWDIEHTCRLSYDGMRHHISSWSIEDLGALLLKAPPDWPEQNRAYVRELLGLKSAERMREESKAEAAKAAQRHFDTLAAGKKGHWVTIVTALGGTILGWLLGLIFHKR